MFQKSPLNRHRQELDRGNQYPPNPNPRRDSLGRISIATGQFLFGLRIFRDPQANYFIVIQVQYFQLIFGILFRLMLSKTTKCFELIVRPMSGVSACETEFGN